MNCNDLLYEEWDEILKCSVMLNRSCRYSRLEEDRQLCQRGNGKLQSASTMALG